MTWYCLLQANAEERHEVPGDDRPLIGTDNADGFDDLSEVTVRIPITRDTPMRRQSKATLRVVAGRDMLQFVTIAPNEQIVIGRDETAQLKPVSYTHLTLPTKRIV